MSWLLKFMKACLPTPLPQNQKSGPTPIAPLLALPTELKMQIISYISDEEDPEPTLIILRYTHRIFRNLVPPAPYGPRVPSNSKLREVRKKRLLQAERRYPYLFPSKMLPCYRCLCVLHRSAFDAYEIYLPNWRVSDHDMGCYPGELSKSLGCKNAHTRRCSRCSAS